MVFCAFLIQHEWNSMIYLIPFLNAIFGWSIISALSWFLFHPRTKKNFFIIELQGLIPKKLPEWGKHAGSYVSKNFLNINKLKESLLAPEKLSRISLMLESKVDDFLRNKLKEKIPVFSMFVTDGLVDRMREILMKELEAMIPELINTIADDLEKSYDIEKLINEKLESYAPSYIEEIFKRQAGNSITQLKIFCAFLGFVLGLLEVLLLNYS